MPLDLVIKNGTVVDGTGMPRARTDIGVRKGKVVARGRLDAAGARVIDAEGKIVAPGFVDIHTHYDAQVLWDPLLTCSPWHGTTTVVIGNCGYSLAPALPRDHQYLAEMFAEVEGMNLQTLEAGLDWRWRSFADYLDRISGQPLGLNVATLVGHSALRRCVLGEEANKRESTPDEVTQLQRLFHEGLVAGAFGLSTSRSANHKGMDQLPVPSRLASREELLDLATVLREFHIGGIEIITDGVFRGDRFPESDEKLLMELSFLSGRPVNYNELSQSSDTPNAWKNQIEFLERATRTGAQIYAVARNQRLDLMFSLDNTNLLDTWPKWKEALAQPRAKKIQLFQDPTVRAALKEEFRVLATRQPLHRQEASLQFVISATGRYAKYQRRTLVEIGRELGKDPLDILLDWSIDEDLQTTFAFMGVRNGDPAAVAQILKSPFALAGISDAGAHTDRMSGSYYSTFLLSHWVRDQQILTLEEAIRSLTLVPASLYGISDRGMIREGLPADIAIFDLEKLDYLLPERLTDFPAGQSRIATRAAGYDHLIVNGEIVMTQGQATGTLPGNVLRSTSYRHHATALR